MGNKTSNAEFSLDYEFKFRQGERYLYDLIERDHGFTKVIQMCNGVRVYSHKSGALLAVHTTEPMLTGQIFGRSQYQGTQMEIAGANFTEKRSSALQASLDEQVRNLIEAKNPNGLTGL